jgi:hypothetical protein
VARGQLDDDLAIVDGRPGSSSSRKYERFKSCEELFDGIEIRSNPKPASADKTASAAVADVHSTAATAAAHLHRTAATRRR